MGTLAMPALGGGEKATHMTTYFIVDAVIQGKNNTTFTGI